MPSSFLPIFLSLLVYAHASCPAGTIQGSSSLDCYKIFSRPTNWVDAENNCQLQGGHLTSILSAFGNSFIQDQVRTLLYNVDYAWTGGNTLWVPGTWTWSASNNKFVYANWANGQPSGNSNLCSVISGVTGQWYSQDCTSKSFPYICKINGTQDSLACTTPNPYVTTPPNGKCSNGYIYNSQTNACYKEYTQQLEFNASQSVCAGDGGNLVSIHSAYENNILGTYFGSYQYNGSFSGDYYIGLTKQTSNWAWLDGTPFDYVNWRVGSPSGDSTDIYGIINLNPGNNYYLTWDNYNAFHENFSGFICKIQL